MAESLDDLDDQFELDAELIGAARPAARPRGEDTELIGGPGKTTDARRARKKRKLAAAGAAEAAAAAVTDDSKLVRWYLKRQPGAGQTAVTKLRAATAADATAEATLASLLGAAFSKKELKAADGKALVGVVLCASGQRCADVIRMVKSVTKAQVGKLFAKHLKLDEQIAMLKKAPPALGVGTPHRVAALLAAGAIDKTSLKLLALDDRPDGRGLTTMTNDESGTPLLALLDDHFLSPDAYKIRLVAVPRVDGNDVQPTVKQKGGRGKGRGRGGGGGGGGAGRGGGGAGRGGAGRGSLKF